jgi:glycosyltransferase involved in cell wall biosynthesis
MGYAGGVPHGMTTYLLLMLPRVRAAGHQVAAAFLRSTHSAATQLEQRGIATQFMDCGRWNPVALAKVARLVRSYRPDVVHATQVKAVAVARALRALDRRFRLIVHMHNLDKTPGPLRWINRRLPQPDTALCVSRPTQITAQREYGIHPSRLHLLLNAFDASAFLASNDTSIPGLRAELGLSPSAPLIGRVARFHPDKGNDRLVRAMPQILAAAPEAVAVFAGDGPDRASCERLARQLGVADQLHFLGQRVDVARIVAACDVMTITSPAEPFGFVALEAFALGKPVVGFRAGGLPEVVTDGVDGLLAAADDEVEFAQLVTRVLLQPELRASLGAAAWQSVRRFDIGAHTDALLAIYAGSAGGAGHCTG